MSPATISSRPSWHRTARPEDDDPVHDDSASSHAGEAILSVWFHQSPAVKDKKVKKSAFNDNNLFKPDDGLVVYVNALFGFVGFTDIIIFLYYYFFYNIIILCNNCLLFVTFLFLIIFVIFPIL